MPTDEALRVVALAPAHAADYLSLFDEARARTSADRPRWAPCYCHFHHVPPPLDWSALDADANRLAMEARIACGEMEGYVAYRGERLVGWLNAQPRHRLQHCEARIGVAAPPLDVPAHEAAAIVCFAVGPGSGGEHVARGLLDVALEDLGARGVRVVDAWPRNDAASDPSHDHFRGLRGWFEAAGFDVVATDDAVLVMRKRLASP